MEQEFKRYEELLGENEPNSVKKYTKVIEFLNGTKYALYDAEFHNKVYYTIYGLIQIHKSGRLYELLNELERKMATIRDELRDQIPRNLKKLGKGGYGCVVQPALPDRIAGNWLPHENNVSKLYFSKKFAEKALKNASSIYNDLKNDGHKMFKQMSFMGASFPQDVQSNCEILPNKEVLALRAPNLGISIDTIGLNYKDFRKIPVGTILEQILKLFSQLIKIQEKRYVHGDIREGNVMANPKTGRLTLIDFDWYMPKVQFFKDYSHALGFYSNPPESLLIDNIKQFLQGWPLQANIQRTKLDGYVNGQNKFLFRTYFKNELSQKSVHDANLENIQQFQQITNIEQYHDALYPSFDSYGLGFTLLEFCYFVYTPGISLGEVLSDNGRKYSDEEIALIETTIHKLFNDILLPMIDLNMLKRLTAKEAFLRMSRLYEDFKAENRSLVSNNLERLSKRYEILEDYKPKGLVKGTIGGKRKTRKHKHRGLNKN